MKIYDHMKINTDEMIYSSNDKIIKYKMDNNVGRQRERYMKSIKRKYYNR